MSQQTTLSIFQALQLADQSFKRGQLPQAEAIYRQVLEAEPASPEALHGLGVIALRVNRPDVALDLLTRSAELLPANAVAQLALGNALLALGRLSEAIAVFRRSIELDPANDAAYCNLGTALQESGQLEEAAEQFQRAIKIRPASFSALNNLGSVYQSLRRFDQAIEAYRRAVAAGPNVAETYNNLASALHESGRVEEAIATCRQALELDPRCLGAGTNLAVFLQFDPRSTPQELFDAHRRWNDVHARPLECEHRPYTNDRSPDRRLRVGYVSPDLREHSVAYFFEPLLAAHDPGNVETFCYADLRLRAVDATTARLQKLAHHWRNITGLGDQRVVEMIRADQIDILVDLAGHTAGNRSLVFARKPAPVQVTYLGYPNTTGMDAIDYRFTDAWADPTGMTEAFHSEQLVRLPQTFLCYRPSDDAPEVSPLPALRRDGQITFGSFNARAKINARVVALWAEILRNCPGSRLLIKCAGLDDAGSRQLLLDLFDRYEIAPERLELRSHVPSMSAHLSLYSEIDIGLDTFPYHGTTTTAEALWMGVPVVTFAGTTHISRVGASMMNNVGLPELVGNSPQEYVNIAVKLAADLEPLSLLRSGMRQRMQKSPLLDSKNFAGAVEAAYRSMWHRHVGI